MEINEKLLKAITLQGGPLGWLPSPPPRLALPPPPPIHALSPPPLPPPPTNILGGPLGTQRLLQARQNLRQVVQQPPPPPPSPWVIDQGAMQQGLIKARNYLRPAGKESIFNPKTEEKIYHNNKEYIIPKKFIKTYNEQLEKEEELKKSHKELSEEKQKQYEAYLDSQEKLKKAKKKKNKLEYKRNVENFTEKIKRPIRDKIFEAIGSDKQQISEEEYHLAPQKSKYDLVRELKEIPILMNL